MVHVDWRKIMAITPENFSEDSKEELMDTLVWYTPSTDVDRTQIIALLKVLQEITKYKGDQVESLMSALDELASKQGEEVARARQDLLDELDEMKEQLEYQRRLEKEGGISDDQLRSDLVRLQMQNEELVLELQEKEKDILAEKEEVEKLAGQVARLEREKSNIANELSAFQEEANERRSRDLSESSDGATARVDELIESVRQKNKHIMQLLDDIEIVEHTNQTLQVKLKTAQKELADANRAVLDMSEKLEGMQVHLADAEAKAIELSDRNTALENQVEELMEKKSRHDRDLDEFAITLNSRVDEWRRLMDAKDAEILEMKEELSRRTAIDSQWSNVPVDNELKTNVVRQTEELITVKSTLNDVLRERDRLQTAVDELKNEIVAKENKLDRNHKIKALQEEIADLKSQVTLADEDAASKAEEITNLVVQIRAYERSEFGLTEAMNQLSKMEKKLKDRDAKIENLIASCNQLEIDLGTVVDDNIYLREKLGLSPSCILPKTALTKPETDDNTIECLNKDIEKLNEVVLDLKLKNRELMNKLHTKSPEKTKNPDNTSATDSVGNAKSVSDTERLEKKYVSVVEENDALRKGMREILQSIQSQSEGVLEVQCLEQLLDALDARHISGWYHPAMRISAELNRMQGECTELRNQLRAARNNYCALEVELEKTKSTLCEMSRKNLEGSNEAHKEEQKENTDGNEGETKSKPFEPPESELRCIKLQMEIDKMEAAKQKSDADWYSEKRQILTENESLKVELETLKYKVKLPQEEDVKYDDIFNFIRLNKVATENTFSGLCTDFMKKQEETMKRIIELQNEKYDLIVKVKKLESTLLHAEPFEKVAAIRKELTQLRLEYRTLINMKSFSSVLDRKQLNEGGDWESEKRALLDEMRAIREKCHELETLIHINAKNGGASFPESFISELSIIASKLAASEVRETAEKQKTVHLEKVIELLRTEQSQFVSREKELSTMMEGANEMNIKLQTTVDSVLNELEKSAIVSEQLEKIQELEALCTKLEIEKNNFQELLEVSRNQCRAALHFSEMKKLDNSTFSECIALLRQGSDGDLVRVSQDLLTARLNLQRAEMKISELQALVSRLLAESLDKEEKLNKGEAAFRRAYLKNLSHFKILYGFLRETHLAFQRALLFPSIDLAFSVMKELDEKRGEIDCIIETVESKKREIIIKEEEVAVQLDAIYDLKSAFQSDSRNLIDWHNKTTELRLREIRSARESEYLGKEVERMQSLIMKLKNDLVEMEEKMLEKEREWEMKQLHWEQFQAELCQLAEANTTRTFPLNELQKESPSDVILLREQISTLIRENEKLSTELSKKDISKHDDSKEEVSRKPSMEGKEVQDFASSIENTRVNKGLESERDALKFTVHSLQSIVKQKEETITRHQQLLKKNREDHSIVVKKLQNELKNVHNSLALQSKAYSRLKHGSFHSGSSIIEDYVTKVQDLEEELSESQNLLTRATSQLRSCQQEVEKWKEIAEERMILAEETKERLENELHHFQEEIQSQHAEAHIAREIPAEEENQRLLMIIHELQEKLSTKSGNRNQTSRGNNFAEAKGNSHGLYLDNLSRKLKSSQDECAQLREQVKNLQNVKRRPISTRRSDNQYPNLMDKIRNLEEMLKLSKQHELELEEVGLKKLRSVEEVARWDERKRYQKNVEKLQGKLKQTEAETSVLKQRVETMRSLINKLEKEKLTLELQSKSACDLAMDRNQLEELLAEKAALAGQVATLEEELTALRRHEGGKAAALLHEKLEEQERKIVALELKNQMPSSASAELDRLNAKLALLQREHGQLEDLVSNLKSSLEKARQETSFYLEKCQILEQGKKSQIMSMAPSRAQTRMAYDSRREVNRVKAEMASLQERLASMVERNQFLEEQVRRLRSELSLWEEKDMADSLTKSTHHQMVSQLHEQVGQLRNQLSHKTNLLERVKILLRRAAAKEKSLNEKVAALENMVAVNQSL